MDDETRNHHPSDEPDLETDTLIRIRGNSSRYFDKKSYLLRFTDEKGDTRTTRSWGWTPTMSGPSTDPIWTRR